MKIMEDYQTLGGPICLDFIATLRSRNGSRQELLDAPDALLAWSRLAQSGSSDQIAECSSADLARAITLRETIHRLIEAARTETPYDPGDLATLNSFARGTDLAPQATNLPGQSHLELKWSNNAGCDAILTTIARDAILLLTGANLDRVKSCANTKCERLFFDDSQARRRRWCSMTRCGNQSKISRYRSRQKSE